MDEEETQIEIGDRVELLPGKDNVYDKAQEGAQGIILNQKMDEGFSMVFIEWDKDVRAYQGEEDCWTFESHFRIVADEDEESFFSVIENPQAFLDEVLARAKAAGRVDDDHIDAFLERLDGTVNSLKDSEGFLLISVQKKEVPPEHKETDGPEFMLVPEIHTGVLSPLAMAAIEAEIVQLAMMAYSELTMSFLSQFARGQEDED